MLMFFNFWPFLIVERKCCLALNPIMTKNEQLRRFVFACKFKLLPIHSTSDIFFKVLCFTLLSSKPLNWERKITTASLDIKDITLSFLLSLLVTWSLIVLILECWSPVFEHWNKCTGMFHWISHWYQFLILGLHVRKEFIFCNHNSLCFKKWTAVQADIQQDLQRIGWWIKGL